MKRSYGIARPGIRPNSEKFILSGAGVRRIFNTPESAEKFLNEMYPNTKGHPEYREGFRVVEIDAPAQAQHTPGPWKYATRDLGNEVGVEIGENEENYICLGPAGFDQHEADARLIAAAPEEDAALRRLHAAVTEWRKTGQPDLQELAAACDQAEEAIEKATGQAVR